LVTDGHIRVDAHAHLWREGYLHPAQREGVPIVATDATLLEVLRPERIDVAVVIPPGIQPDNQLVLEMASRAHGRFVAVVVLDPRSRSFAEDAMRCAANGAAGVRVSNYLGSGGPRDVALAELASVAVETGLAIDWTMDESSSHAMERVASLQPSVRQVVDHLAWPAFSGRPHNDVLRDLATIPALTVKLSGMYAISAEGWPYADVWPWLERVSDAFGPERMMWGSDWPLSVETASYGRQLELVRSIPWFDAQAQASILGATASRFWRPT
jgi:L-fuconolactonase